MPFQEARLTTFSALLAGLVTTPTHLTATIGDDWRQGRTLYGGLSAALCVQAAQLCLPGLPPLRSAQFAFIGPASGDITAQPTLLRRGKSTAFAGVDLHGDAGLATRALLCFAAARASALTHTDIPPPNLPPPADCPNFFDGRLAPAFSHHFEARHAGGARLISGATTPELLLWIRHRDRTAGHAAPALTALADVAPPAAMTMFDTPAPISTMTWSIELLAAPTALPDDAWLLMRSTARTVANGYSTQDMALWDSTGTPLMSSTQCVAIFR